MPDHLDARYQKVLELSRQMLEAGKEQDWDLVLALESQRQSLFTILLSGKGNRLQVDLADTLTEILSCDTELMDRVDHWLQHARILLRMPAGHNDSQS